VDRSGHQEAASYLSAYLADPARDESLLRRALASDPELASAHFALSVRHLSQSDEAAAEIELKRTIALAPDTAPALGNLATIHEARSDFTEALISARRAMLLEPGGALFQANLASVLAKIDRAVAALWHYRAAIALNPAHYKIRVDYGITLTEIGRRDAARACFQRANQLDPYAVRPVRLAAELEKVTQDSPVLESLRRLAGVQGRLPAADRSELSFALSKCLADLGETDQAFAALRIANDLRRALTPYDEAASLDRLETIAALFTAPAIRAARAEGAAGRQPVFIVGMPRCGSTLVEQILAGHADVAATGESKLLPKLMRQHGPSSYGEVGTAYLARLAETYPSARRVTDKMLGNFTRLGFIAGALPGARIIHDPGATRSIAVCRSIPAISSRITPMPPISASWGAITAPMTR
jgi:tetratricopeptide (TPR) repeat protein